MSRINFPVPNVPPDPNNPLAEEEVFHNWLLSLFNVTDSTTVSDASSESGGAGDGVGVHRRPSMRSFFSNPSSTFNARLGASEHFSSSYSDQPMYHDTSERGISSSSSTMDVSTSSSYLPDMMLEEEDIEMDSSTGDTIAHNRHVAMSVSDEDSYDADGETSSENEGEDVLMRNDINL